MIARRRITRAAVPLTSDPIAMPSTRLMTAVATFWDIGAVVLNGYTTAINVASPMIQPKNSRGRGGRERIPRGGRVAPCAVPARRQDGDVEQPPAYQDAGQRYQRRDERRRHAARPQLFRVNAAG